MLRVDRTLRPRLVPQEPLELWFHNADAPALQPTRRRVAPDAIVDDLKAAWLAGEESPRSTFHARILLLRAPYADATEALNPRLSMREAGLRSGDSLWVKITPPAPGTRMCVLPAFAALTRLPRAAALPQHPGRRCTKPSNNCRSRRRLQTPGQLLHTAT